MRRRTLACLPLMAFAVCAAVAPTAAVRVIVDCDPAFLDPHGLDVDDELALLYLLGARNVTVLGVTVAPGGNSANSFQSAAALVTATGADVEVVHPSGAAGFICSTLQREAPGVTLLALGPLTNLAAAAEACPPAFASLGRLVMMGGDVTAGNVDRRAPHGPWWVRAWNAAGLPLLPDVDLNFVLSDADATRAVLATAVPKLVIPVQACLRAAFPTPPWEALLAACADPSTPRRAVCLLAAKLQAKPFTLVRHLVSHVFSGPGYDEFKHVESSSGRVFHPWDLVAAGAVVLPGAFTDKERWAVRVRSDGWGTVWSKAARPGRQSAEHLDVWLGVDADAVLEHAAAVVGGVPWGRGPSVDSSTTASRPAPARPQRRGAPVGALCLAAVVLSAAVSALTVACCVVRCVTCRKTKQE